MQSFSVFSSGFFSSEFFVPQISQMTQIFFIGDFFHRISRNLFGGFLLRRLLTDFRGCDLSGRCRYPLRLEKVPQIYTDLHRFWTCSVFGKMHADFADDADFFVGDLCFFVPQISQIYTDSGHVRSLEKSTQISQILLLEICVFFVPQISQIYTDSGLVRSLEKNTQISQMTQFLCLDIWGIFLSIMARMNLCKSVESVGLLKRLTFSAFFNTLLPALFLPA